MQHIINTIPSNLLQKKQANKMYDPSVIAHIHNLNEVRQSGGSIQEQKKHLANYEKTFECQCNGPMKRFADGKVLKKCSC
jgi:hypothetical protein